MKCICTAGSSDVSNTVLAERTFMPLPPSIIPLLLLVRQLKTKILWLFRLLTVKRNLFEELSYFFSSQYLNGNISFLFHRITIYQRTKRLDNLICIAVFRANRRENYSYTIFYAAPPHFRRISSQQLRNCLNLGYCYIRNNPYLK